MSNDNNSDQVIILDKRVKYKDIILSDSDSGSESESESESKNKSNTYINNKVTLLKKNYKKQFIKAKGRNKKPIIKIKKDLYQFKNLVNKNIFNANNKINNMWVRFGIKSNIELLDRHDIFNKYFIKSIKFLEKSYFNYVKKQINKVDNCQTDIYLDQIYKIKFYYSVSEYEDIINIYKNMKKELILDYEKILRHNNLILDQDQDPDNNLKYLTNWFVIRVDYKYFLTNKYFDNQIKYYSFLHFTSMNIYNYTLFIGLIAIIINFLLKSNYKIVFMK